MLSKNRTLTNLVCSIIVLGTGICINFFMSPYIVKTIGVEANGFITLANNFITYLNLLVLALNSMAARFISIEYNKKNYEKANLYYNSIFWGNLVLVAIMLPAMIFLLSNLEKFIDIPVELISDVKILFFFVFLNFFIVTAAPNWECGVFVTNRLDRQYIPSVLTAILKCVFLFSLLTLTTPKVWYIGLVAMIIGILNLLVNGYNTNKLTPKLKVHLWKENRICSWKAIKELLSAGIWNSISSVGFMLLNGLDLLIANLFINSTIMGMISLSKILQTLISEFSNSIVRVFVPSLVIDYAHGNKDKFLYNIKKYIKITSILLLPPLVGVIVLSEDFFRLWVPGQDCKFLATLSILSCVGYIFISGGQVLFEVFSITNQLKLYSSGIIVSGIVSTCLVLQILNNPFGQEYGPYFIAGTSTVVAMIRNVAFFIPLSAKCLGYRWFEFYPINLVCISNAILCIIVSSKIKNFFVINGWFSFVFAIGVIMLISFAISYIVVLNKLERKELCKKVKSVFH